MTRRGKLGLPNLDGMDLAPVQIEAPAAEARPTWSGPSGTIDVIKQDVAVRLDPATPVARIAHIARGLAT